MFYCLQQSIWALLTFSLQQTQNQSKWVINPSPSISKLCNAKKRGSLHKEKSFIGDVSYGYELPNNPKNYIIWGENQSLISTA